MKKKIIILIILVIIGFTLSCTQSFENTNGTSTDSEDTAEKNSNVSNKWVDIYNSINDKKITDEEKIKEIVTLYYKIQYEESITLELIDTSFMVAKNAVMKDEEILRACHLQRLRNMGEHYLDYKLKIDFKGIKLSENSADIELFAVIVFHYASSPKAESSIGEESRIVMTKVDGRWVINEFVCNTAIKEALKNRKLTPKQYLDLLKKGEN